MRNPSRLRIVSVVDDLFFAARIEAVAKAAGASVVLASEPSRFWAVVAEETPGLILLDLNGKAVAPIEILEKIKADPRFAGTRVIGFCSHVRRDLQRAAAESGCDEVMSRSEFTKKLPSILLGERP